MKPLIALFGLVVSSIAVAQAGNDGTLADSETAAGKAAAAEEIDREPVRCISIPRIDRTEIIDARTVLFYMRGGRDIYRNQLTHDCPRLVREKRFSYNVRTSQLCNVDYISVLEWWGGSLRQGAPCGLGMFYPITEEEAELLNADPDEMLEAAGAVKETVESSGEAVIRDDEADEN